MLSDHMETTDNFRPRPPAKVRKALKESTATPNVHFPSSASESSVSDQFNTVRTRKVSIAMADLSLLADQNAELLSKLQKLEEDSTSADVAGRRELKRLEKEIVSLREALEKTQAKSEELEGKVTKAVTSDAVRRKREGMRSAERTNNKEGAMLDFAPPGSKYGGPSEAYSLLGNDSPGWRRPFSPPRKDHAVGDMADSNQAQEPRDQALFAQLLEKVKELEETNNRILTQQLETSNQLATVQREAVNMTMVYEFLSDKDAIELEFESDANAPNKPEKAQVKAEDDDEPPTIRFRSLMRNIESSFGSSSSGSFNLPRLLNEATKSRGSVLGLFEGDTPTGREEVGVHRRRSSQESRSSTPSMPLSPLPFFSPLPQTQPEFPRGLTLQNELENKFGQGSWGISGSNHMRDGSLSNLSQFSVPSTPSPAPSLATPTPHAQCGRDLGGEEISAPETVQKTGSSRLRHMSKTLQLRRKQWVEKMYQGNHGLPSPADNEAASSASSLSKADATPPRRLSDAVGNITATSSASEANSSDITIDDGSKEGSNDHDDSADRKGAATGASLSETPIFTVDAELQQQQQLALESQDQGEDAPTTTAAVTKRHDKEPEKGVCKYYAFQAWLWFQFAIVVFVFIFTMAKKGPGTILVSENERSGRSSRSKSRKGKAAVARRI